MVVRLVLTSKAFKPRQTKPTETLNTLKINEWLSACINKFFAAVAFSAEYF
jgi:hypothetical protein